MSLQRSQQKGLNGLSVDHSTERPQLGHVTVNGDLADGIKIGNGSAETGCLRDFAWGAARRRKVP